MQYKKSFLRDLMYKFAVYGDFLIATPFGMGNVNDTFQVTFDQGGVRLHYILQRINRNVFHNPDFVRGQEGDPPNNLLNYGYAILRAVIARSLVGSGLIPTLGIHHHNRYNAYCLADDIMEPYRPYVDELVIQIMAAVEDYTELTRDIKAMLLKIPVLDVEIEGKRYPLMVAAGITTASVAKCFSGESRQIKYPSRL